MLRYVFMLLTVNCYKAGSSHEVTSEGPLPSHEFRNCRADFTSRPNRANSRAKSGGDNNYNSCGIVGKLQAERPIQYHTGHSGALKKMYWFPSSRSPRVTKTAIRPVLKQDGVANGRYQGILYFKKVIYIHIKT